MYIDNLTECKYTSKIALLIKNMYYNVYKKQLNYNVFQVSSGKDYDNNQLVMKKSNPDKFPTLTTLDTIKPNRIKGAQLYHHLPPRWIS